MSFQRPNKNLENLLHEVNSKCSSLKDAAVLLQKSPQIERAELLALMAQESRNLAQYLAEMEQRDAAG